MESVSKNTRPLQPAMKTSQLATLPVALISICALVPTRIDAAISAIPSTPVGRLSAYPSVVQTGTKPTLTWEILYPSVVADMARIDTPGTITVTAANTFVSVQPIGTGITACTAGQTSESLYTDARMSINGGTYKQLFYGTQADVNSAYSLYIKMFSAGDKLNFSGRYVRNGAWSPLYTTISSNFQVISLINGDTPPTSTSLYQSSTLASYLRPYLDTTGKIKIGPLSIIIMMELGQTNHSMSCFDYQDMILLVTLGTKHPNNGHGNNLDGVDSSNPGQGQGGPNGLVDPSGGVDDEIR